MKVLLIGLTLLVSITSFAGKKNIAKSKTSIKHKSCIVEKVMESNNILTENEILEALEAKGYLVDEKFEINSNSPTQEGKISIALNTVPEYLKQRMQYSSSKPGFFEKLFVKTVRALDTKHIKEVCIKDNGDIEYTSRLLNWRKCLFYTHKYSSKELESVLDYEEETRKNLKLIPSCKVVK